MTTASFKKLPMKIIAVSVLCALLLLNLAVQTTDGRQTAPNHYVSRCVHCGHTDYVDPLDIQKSNFLRIHPDKFAEVYPGQRRPAPHHCAGCGELHRNASLVVCPRTNKRFALLDTIVPGESTEQEPDLNALSPF